MNKNRKKLFIIIGFISFLIVGYQSINYLYSEYLYPPQFEITIVNGNEEIISQFKQRYEGHDRIIGMIENVSQQELLNSGRTNLTEINKAPLVSIFKYTSVKTAEVGLETYDIKEAISYLEKELR